MVTYPNNTLAQYITNLPRRISVSGDWECGITEVNSPHDWYEIHYPHDWYNVRNSRMTVEYEECVHNVFLADGYYDSPETLVNTLNGEKPGRVQLSYNSVKKLGKSVTTGENRSIALPANSIVDLRRGFESLYVYLSLVEPRIVGDKIVPLLRIVPITGRNGEMVTTRFDHLHYTPIMHREFGTVETEIRDDTGQPVPFERGKVTVTLHFRRRRSGLFR